MAKFRKKPVVIEAFQWWGGTNPREHEYPVMGRDSLGRRFTDIPTIQGTIRANKGEKTIRVNEGDWIITGIMGKPFPCKPDVFEATYEPVVDEGKR